MRTSPSAISATSAALSAVLLVLLTVLVPLSALSAWVDLEIDDTDRYVAAVSPLASDPAVQTTVADLVTEEAMRQIDLGPLQDTVREFLHETVRSFTTTEAFRNAWDTANRAAHKAVAAALDGDSGEAVTIDLAPVIDQVKQDLVRDGVPFADQIPVERTEITVLGPGQADDLRNSFRLLRYGSIWPASPRSCSSSWWWASRPYGAGCGPGCGPPRPWAPGSCSVRSCSGYWSRSAAAGCWTRCRTATGTRPQRWSTP